MTTTAEPTTPTPPSLTPPTPRSTRRLRRAANGQTAPGMGETVVQAIVLGIFCLAVIVPFLGVVSTSLSSSEHLDAAGGFVLFPDGVNFDAYRSVLSGGVVLRALLVSIGVAGVGTVLSLLVSAMLAFGLSRPGSFGQRPMLLIVLFTLLFSPGILPLYLTVRSVGLIDSWWALILPSMINAFNVIVLRAFFMNIPVEIVESARIDGASDFQVFWRVILPMSKAVLAVVGLFYAVGYWNAFFNALIYLQDQTKWPLTLVMRSYILQGTQLSPNDLAAVEAAAPQPALQMAILVVAIVPILVVYPFLQKHFTAGTLTGAVKG